MSETVSALDVIDPAGATHNTRVTLLNPSTGYKGRVKFDLRLDMKSLAAMTRAGYPMAKARRQIATLFRTQQWIVEEIRAHAEANGVEWDDSMLAEYVVPFGEESERLARAIEEQDTVDTDNLVFHIILGGLNNSQSKAPVSKDTLFKMLPLHLIGDNTEAALSAFMLAQARPEDLTAAGESQAPEAGAEADTAA